MDFSAYFKKIKDQGPHGSCYLYAASAGVEAAVARRQRRPQAFSEYYFLLTYLRNTSGWNRWERARQTRKAKAPLEEFADGGNIRMATNLILRQGSAFDFHPDENMLITGSLREVDRLARDGKPGHLEKIKLFLDDRIAEFEKVAGARHWSSLAGLTFEEYYIGSTLSRAARDLRRSYNPKHAQTSLRAKATCDATSQRLQKYLLAFLCRGHLPTVSFQIKGIEFWNSQTGEWRTEERVSYHGGVITGLDTRRRGGPYFIIRNSWGAPQTKMRFPVRESCRMLTAGVVRHESER